MDSLEELNERHRRFVEDRNWQKHQSPKNLVMALTAEVGELVELFQWLTPKESREVSGGRRQAVAEEMADVLIYLVRLADETGIDLVAAAHEKCEINERKYPAEAFREKDMRPHEYKGQIMPGKWKLTITQEFSASHQLRNYCGKCENMHGHNFGVEVVVEGDTLDPEVQYLVDFKELKSRTRAVLDRLDHTHLNEVECFKEINPSSENLAMFIYRNLKGTLPENVSLVEVSVSEKNSSKATYWEE